MPGLSQLIQFNKDILSLGDEIQLRAQRGEKPVRVPVPKVPDVDDSDEFVMGMPEKEAVVQDTSVDDDLSDLQSLTGTSDTSKDNKDNSSKNKNTESADDASSSFDAPDLSTLLAPMPATDAFGDSADMPDLSMFLEQEQAEPEEEPEPEETSIADLGLEALLGGAGFDGSSSPTAQETTSSSTVNDDDLEFYSGGFGDDNYVPQKKKPHPQPVFEDTVSAASDGLPADIFADLAAQEQSENTSSGGDALSLEELGLGDLDAAPEELVEPVESLDDGDALEPLEEIESLEAPADFETDTTNLTEDISQGDGMDFAASTDSLSDSVFDAPELSEGFGSDFGQADGLDSLEPLESFDSFETSEAGDTFDMPDMSAADFSETPAFDSAEPASDDFTANPFDGDFGSFDEVENTASDSNFEDSDSSLNSDNNDYGSLTDFNLDDMDGLDNAGATSSSETDFMQDIPDISGDFGDISDFGDSSSNETEDLPLETFDAPEMEGVEFDMPDTDSQLESNAASDVDDFGDGDFNIPGFSDVETAKEEKHGPLLLKTGGNGKSAEEKLPPNTLSDAQYKVFLKNLSEYPLNVRLAFEDLIVKNEFTDDAEFEIVEKILNKAPARQVASLLEKMLDISIPVPRNYEQRTAEEYEAYKKSLSYQLKNKIIPAVFACMILLVVGFGLFKFAKNCIYIPAMANHLYKQGYTMLCADEYPQSEIKYEAAKNYRVNKKWFFKYARGYRERKQYIRAENTYMDILRYFRHDKTAGLEYARMELDDLANYEKAEEICRREVLDYHINDADGILLLGDIFLEWGTEKDPEKLEIAREQYATLIQLYKSTMLYQSRMMRYFIRTDNLTEVLNLKAFFLPKEKNLSAEDWTELSGYLLDKLYGPLAPSDEYLRAYIEDVRLLLTRAYKLDPKSPNAAYNLSRYFIETNESHAAKDMLDITLTNFNNAPSLHRRDIYKYIDTYRLAGEEYAKVQEFLRAQEYYTDGITLYIAERDASGLEGNKKIGQLFADQADMDYFITGDYDNALLNYIASVELENDNPSIRYKIGYIQYKKKNYSEALGSFMKAGNGNIKEPNLMLAMGNTLSLRGDNYAAQGYYENLIEKLDKTLDARGITFPQSKEEDHQLITTYLRAANNYGVTLYHLASRTGNSAFNAKAIVQFSQSVRAWDALTRNQVSMVRLGGSNLAEENIKYITHPVPDFEPAIYTEIPSTIVDNEKISY